MESRNGQIADNLERAKHLAEQAAARGAQIILFPEFMPTGYVLSRSIWSFAEPTDGRTPAWLRENSKRLGVWMGTSYLEAYREDFFNTFVLTDPHGEEVARVRKRTPGFTEAYYFRGGTDPHTVETEFGTVGISICYENILACQDDELHRESVDLIFAPTSAPMPSSFRGKDFQFYYDLVDRGAQRLAQTHGVPVVLANKCGPWESPMSWHGPYQRSYFPGRSTIADSDGTVKAQLDDQEGILVEDVSLNQSLKVHKKPARYGRWSLKVRPVFKLLIAEEVFGKLSYTMSSGRRKAARKMSANT